MISSFNHVGLKEFFLTGKKSGIQPAHAERLARILSRLQCAKQPQDMNLAGLGLHKLSGDLANHWSVRVNAGWRVIFCFNPEGHVCSVDYVNYH